MESLKPNEMRLVRTYDAPLALVWEVWTQPDHLAQWWGPRGFTTKTSKFEMRVAGNWTFTMTQDDGTVYPNSIHFAVVDDKSKLVYGHGVAENTPPMFMVRVDFSEQNSITQMIMTMELESAEAVVETKKHVKAAGGETTWDRLAEYLERLKSGQDVFVMQRSLSSTKDKVFDAWTRAESVSQWLPPEGFKLKWIERDFRIGGMSFYSMSNDEMNICAKDEYLEIQPPTKLVYSQHFCDEKGRATPHPLAPVWPKMMLNTVTLLDDPEGVRIQIVTAIMGDSSEAERAAFVEALAGMSMGWTSSFDQLERLLT